MAEAVAKAAGVPRRRRAAGGDVRRLAADRGRERRSTSGAPALAAIELTPAAAGPADARVAGDQTSPTRSPPPATASVEWKLDGARIQAHRPAATCACSPATSTTSPIACGGVVDVVRALPGGDLVLDGEVLGVADDGTPRRFQDTMGDFGADAAPGAARGLAARSSSTSCTSAATPSSTSRCRCAASARRDRARADAGSRRSSPPTRSRPSGSSTRAMAAGHEGVMVKDLASPTTPGGAAGRGARSSRSTRSTSWCSPSSGDTAGARAGCRTCTSARAARDGEFVMVGKTFKGLTDELLRWQTERFQRSSARHGARVTSCTSGPSRWSRSRSTACRCRRATRAASRCASPRVRRYRDDKPAAEADTIEHVQALLR